MCDDYFDPRHCECGGMRTRFIIKSWEMTNDYAKLALNFYNQKTHKNFNLEEVVKLNRTPSAFYCMTFKARNAESDECYLFQGVVSVVGGPQVLLCEIKDEKEISIPADHDEYYDEESSGSMEDIYPYTKSENDLGVLHL
ncbi:uncharacterized protein [Primulina huaijiensis]|uniref:uncharacterized protein n=1 Tax=Primulina huaijiensis TaxID=1492673 RepID=UPI003CC75DC7